MLTPALDNICFMDMRAEEKLKPQEASQFKFVVFGGILGDHPPQDRAKEFRDRFSHIRQLGTVQMTTDTAVLVSHEILAQKRPFESLSFLDEPTIPMDDSVSHFLDKSLSHAQLSELPSEASFDFKKHVETQMAPLASEFRQFLQ